MTVQDKGSTEMLELCAFIVILLVLAPSVACAGAPGPVYEPVKVITPTQPYRFEALLGRCKQSAVGDGVWWNSNYPHTLDLSSTCGQVGVSKLLWKAGTFDAGLRLAYVNFGTITAVGVYPVLDEEQFTTKPSGKHCDSVTLHGCVGKGYGTQKAEGVSFGYIVEDEQGPITWGADAGLFLYYSSWAVRITQYPYDSGQFGPWSLKWSGWQATPYFGFNARYKYLFAQFRVYGSLKAAEHGCGGCSGVTGGPATMAAVGVSVPF